jgi:hypothetical protein
VETGRRLIDVAVLERLVVALGLGDEATRRLLTQARQEYAMPVARRVDAGVSLAAGRLVRLASGAQLMRSFSAAMVPALLRTADYAQAAGSDADQEALATWPAAS